MMADNDMANGDEHARRLYLDAVQAQLGERVTNLGRRQTDLENEMRTGFRQIEQSIAGLSANLSERNKPHWQALGVALTFAALIGGLAYLPIREATTDLKAAVIDTNKSITSLATATVSRGEWSENMVRAAENRQRLESAIAKLAENAVARNELTQMVTEYRDYKARIETELVSKLDRVTWEERNHARDVELADLRRRLDEIRQEVGAVYGTRDVILDLKKEIDSLRQRINLRGIQSLP